jgi:hypothetical protein
MAKITHFVPESDIEYIKIYGLQRAGTNYLAMLVNDNFRNVESLINVGGWKHGHYYAPWVLGQEVHVLTITKNPYAWLSSLYKYWTNNPNRVGPNLTGVSFDQFVRSKTEFERQDGIPFLYRAQNPVQFWNDMNFHWMSIRLKEKKALVIPYEAILMNGAGVMESVGKELGLIPLPSFTDTSWSVLPSEEKPKIGETLADREHYLKEKYLDEYSPETLGFINSQLDKEVMAALGYAFVN